MGLADLIKFNQWRISSGDSTNAWGIDGQYQPENFAIESAPVLASNTTAGSARPYVQWVAGGSRTVRFESQFRSLHNLDDIGDKIEFLEGLTAKDENLGRAPRVTFAWGRHEIEGFVSRCPIRIAGYWATGFPRQVSFEIEITEAPESAGEPTAGETQFVRLASGELLESLGARHLGNPLRGELIRRINPRLSVRPERAGDVVRVFEREHPDMRGPVAPGGVPFTEQSAAPGDWQAVVEELGVERGVEQRGLPWRLLPEVLAGLVV